MRDAFLAVASLAVIAFAPVHAATDQGERKEEKKGDVDDVNGNLAWRAAAHRKTDSKSWEYARFATNRSTTHRCRIWWKYGGDEIKSLLPMAKDKNPTEKRLSSETDEDAPKDINGELRYNGGRAPGEGKKDAAVWSPRREGKPSRSVKATAELGFEVEKTYYELAVNATSRSDPDKGEIEYELTVAKGKDSEGVAAVNLLWTPFEKSQPMVKEALAGVREYDAATGTFKIRLDEQQSVAIKFTVRGAKVIDKVAGAIRLYLPTDTLKRQVLAEAPMPLLFSIMK